MPRKARIDYPGALHHVIARGINRNNIFEDDQDKSSFLYRLKNLLSENSIQCYSWCIMDNHFHLLLLRGETSLSYFMRCLLTGYAVYFNRAHKRSGHLFQNRYKSIVCNKDEYLLTLVRYIHLNPVRSKKISLGQLDQYLWTGHRELVTKGLTNSVLVRDEVLRYFGIVESKAIARYKDFIKSGIDNQESYDQKEFNFSLVHQKENKDKYDGRILGGTNFINEVYKQLGMQDEKAKHRKTIRSLLRDICDYYSIEEGVLMRSRRKEVRAARDVFIYLGNILLGKSITSLGEMLGIKQPAASLALRRGEAICKKNKLMEEFHRQCF